MFDWVNGAWDYLVLLEIWNNVWQVVGAMLGVLGAYLMAGKATKDSNEQLEKQLRQEKIQHEQQLKQAKIQHDSELLVAHDNIIDELNAKRREFVREIGRLNNEHKKLIEQKRTAEIEMEYLAYAFAENQKNKEIVSVEFKQFLKSYLSIVKNSLLIIRIVKNGEYENYSEQIVELGRIYNYLSTAKFNDPDNEEDWGRDILNNIDGDSTLKKQCTDIKQTINDTLDELLK